jgi:hypothetical protein
MFMPHLVILPIVMKQIRESVKRENEKNNEKGIDKTKNK